MRMLPIGPAAMRGFGVLLVGIGLLVVVFASREVTSWPKAGAGAAIAGLGGSLLLAVRTLAQRYRQCPACAREFLADAAKCPYCGTRFSSSKKEAK